MPTKNEYLGHCFCGAVEIRVTGKPAAPAASAARRCPWQHAPSRSSSPSLTEEWRPRRISDGLDLRSSGPSPSCGGRAPGPGAKPKMCNRVFASEGLTGR